MPPDFSTRSRELCDAHGILYVDDEVQAGCGRTGHVWAIEHYGVEPDLLVSGKSLGGGLPLAAVTGSAELMDAVAPGGLGGTFGGNPLACAAALAILDELAAADFRARAEEVGGASARAARGYRARQPIVGEVRGLGPMLAIELCEQTTATPPKAHDAAAREAASCSSRAASTGTSSASSPRSSATDEELDRGLGILEESLGDAGAGGA